MAKNKRYLFHRKHVPRIHRHTHFVLEPSYKGNIRSYIVDLAKYLALDDGFYSAQSCGWFCYLSFVWDKETKDLNMLEVEYIGFLLDNLANIELSNQDHQRNLKEFLYALSILAEKVVAISNKNHRWNSTGTR